ncbi:MAG: SHOCT domain-containing protein, partial [Bacteroidales bacterium]|nr:SHOCT domain-containing protein [Bacteroidales bacterium]
VQKENCEQQTIHFTSKVLREWAVLGTIFGWTGSVGRIPLPWGIAVDAATGAWWKPDITEKGVSKIDYDHFLYTIYYNTIPTKHEISDTKENASTKDKTDRLIQLKKLLDEGILTQEEYEKEKAKILHAD